LSGHISVTGIDYGLCVRVSVCNVGVLRLKSERIELIFGVRVTTEDNYFVSDVGPDPPTERDTSSRREVKISACVQKFKFLVS